METCPDTDTLRMLLDESPSSDDFVDVETHIETCPRCRVRLAELTTLPIALSRSPRTESDRDESEMAGLIDRLTERIAAENSDASSSSRVGEPPSGRFAPDRPSSSRRASIPDIPGFEILGELGRGGMSVVYKARQTRLNRICALKLMLDAEHASERSELRFLGEAETVARLSHPNVNRIHSIGEHEGRPFLELEYVDGGTLRDRIAGGPMMPETAARFAETLAAVLVELHGLGIIHRDLKPANILLTRDGTPKVADFGLAKSTAAAGDLTHTRTVVGSPSYMAPEQAEPGRTEITPAADIHAIGVILYEMLVGRPPYQAATILETLEQVRHGEPVSPARLVPGIPRDLVTIVLKCLDKIPSRRYAGAAELLADLRLYLDGQPILGRRAGPWERSRRWCRRRPAAATGLAVAICAVVGVFGVIAEANVRLRWKQDELNSALGSANRERLRAESMVSRLALSRGIASGESGEVGVGLLWMARAARQALADQPELKAEIAANLASWSRLHPRLIRTFDHGAPILSADRSPDGKTLLTGGQDRITRLWDVETAKVLARTPVLDESVVKVAFRPDARSFVTVECGEEFGTTLRLSVWSTDDFRRLRIHECPGRRLRGFAIHPDGRAAALSFIGPKGDTFRTVDLETGLEIARPLPRPVSGPVAFSPSANEMAFSTQSQSWIADSRTLEFKVGLEGITQTNSPRAAVHDLCFTPDGRYVLAGGGTLTARLFAVADGKPFSAEFRHTDAVRSVAVSPDGMYAATGSFDRTARIWDLGMGRQIGSALIHGDAVRSVEFGPDGLTLSTAGDDGIARLWDIREPLGLDTIVLPRSVPVSPAPIEPRADPRNFVSALSRSGDGSRLFIAYQRGDSRLWDLKTGRPVGPAMNHIGRLHAARFSPDSTTLVTGGGWINDVCSGRLRRASDGKPLSPTFEHRYGYIRDVDISPDGRTAVTSGFDNDINFWDLARGGAKAGAAIRGIGLTFSIRFSPDGRRLLMGYEAGQAQLWDVATRTPVGPPMRHGHNVSDVDFSPNGRVIATAGLDGSFRLWDASDGRLIGRPIRKSSDFLTAWAFSSDSRTILLGSMPDHSARFYDTITGNAIGEPLMHRSIVTDVAIHPSGRTVMTLCADGELRLWDFASRHPLGPPMLVAGGGGVRALFSVDGSRLIVACKDGTTRLVPLPTRAERSLDVLAADAERDTGLLGVGMKSVLPEDLRSASDAASASDALEPIPVATDAWDAAQLAVAVARRDWFAASRHLDRLSDDPRDGWRRALRVRVLLARGRAGEADAIVKQVRADAAAREFRDALDNDCHARELDADWMEALWYLDRMLGLDPENPIYLMRRSRVLAELARVPEAGADLTHALKAGLDATELERFAYEAAALRQWRAAVLLNRRAGEHIGPTSSAWVWLAISQVKSGDHAGYRSTCEQVSQGLSALAKDTARPDRLFRQLTILALAPVSIDLERPIAVGRDALARVPASEAETANQLRYVLGLMLVRSSRYQDAITQLEQVPDRRQHPADKLFLGIAHQRLGHESEASKLFDLARAKIQKRRDYVGRWDDTEGEILAAEMAAVLGSPAN